MALEIPGSGLHWNEKEIAKYQVWKPHRHLMLNGLTAQGHRFSLPLFHANLKKSKSINDLSYTPHYNIPVHDAASRSFQRFGCTGFVSVFGTRAGTSFCRHD